MFEKIESFIPDKWFNFNSSLDFLPLKNVDLGFNSMFQFDLSGNFLSNNTYNNSLSGSMPFDSFSLTQQLPLNPQTNINNTYDMRLNFDCFIPSWKQNQSGTMFCCSDLLTNYNQNYLNTLPLSSTTSATSKKVTTTTPKVKLKETIPITPQAKTTSSFAGTSINGISSIDVKQYNVSEVTLSNGMKIYKTGWARYDKCQKEFLDQFKYMDKAAKELGLTILRSDGERTKEESNISRAKKGSLVAQGGKSPHNYGCASDIVVYKNGKQVSVLSPEYREFVNRAIKYSNGALVCGLNWKKKGEQHHWELRDWEKYQNDSNLLRS